MTVGKRSGMTLIAISLLAFVLAIAAVSLVNLPAPAMIEAALPGTLDPDGMPITTGSRLLLKDAGAVVALWDSQPRWFTLLILPLVFPQVWLGGRLGLALRGRWRRADRTHHDRTGVEAAAELGQGESQLTGAFTDHLSQLYGGVQGTAGGPELEEDPVPDAGGRPSGSPGAGS